jgi:hypothetical protein
MKRFKTFSKEKDFEDFEEDACGGKTFETMRKENKKEEKK